MIAEKNSVLFCAATGESVTITVVCDANNCAGCAVDLAGMEFYCSREDGCRERLCGEDCLLRRFQA